MVPRSTNNDRKRVAYEAKQASRGQSAKPGKVIQYLRQEPTWGNPDVLLTAIPVLSPANSDDLMSGFGLPVYAPKHIQTVRNACAHLNAETMADVRSLLVFYRGSGLSHPLDILLSLIHI
ncbi:MAG: hypothetical protein KUG81_06285 [Gammaproteobacteria bacterium]|nr:hypothetical protein [Gammaproteobacteria bacterium]